MKNEKIQIPSPLSCYSSKLKEEIDLATTEEMGTADHHIPILLVTQFGIHNNHLSDKIWIDKVLAEKGEVALLYRGYLSNRQAGELRVVELNKKTNFSSYVNPL